MIVLSLIARSRDGLPLAANTDGDGENNSINIQEGHKHMKLLARISARFPDRCSYTIDNICIHFISALGLTFSVLCDTNYPPVLAFSFLMEIEKEFLQCYEKNKVDSLIRPYELIAFDGVLQKLKHRYNNPRSLTARLNLSDLSHELRLRPSHIISPEEIQPCRSASKFAGGINKNTAFFQTRFLPFGIVGLLSVCLNCFCAFLNLTRGFAVINDAHIDDFSYDHYQYAATFLLCCFLSLYQIYLMYHPHRRRQSLACATLGSICLCQIYLWEYRSNILILFHMSVACLGTFVIFTRRVSDKLPQYAL